MSSQGNQYQSGQTGETSPQWNAPPPPPPPPPPGATQQHWLPPYPNYAQVRTNESTAVVVLVLAIVSWLVLPLVPAIIAVALAPSSRRKIAQSNGALDGEGMLMVGVIASWINIAFYSFLILGAIALLVAALAFA